MAKHASIIDEAITEAKALREAAEKNAKNAIIEALTPRIRSMIESQLLGESDDESDDESMLFDTANSVMGDLSGLDPAAPGSQADKKLASSDALSRKDPVTPLGEYVLSNEAADTLSKISSASDTADLVTEIQGRLDVMVKRIKFAKELEINRSKRKSDKGLTESHMSKLVRDAITLKGDVIRIGEHDAKGPQGLVISRAGKIIKEITQMARKLNETDVNLKVTLPDDLDIDVGSLSASVDGAEGDEGSGDLDFGGDDSGADLEIPDMGSEDGEDIEEGDDDFDLGLDDDGGESLDFGDDAGAGLEGESDDGLTIKLKGLPDDLDIDLSQVGVEVVDDDSEDEDLENSDDDSETQGDQDMDMEDEDQGDEKVEEGQDAEVDEVYEIDEAELAEALSEMGLSEGDATAPVGVKSFGGGKLGKEPFVDMTDDDLNVQSESKKNSAKKAANEGRENRALREQLTESNQIVDKLRKRLVEMNLFSAKLLSVNKLIQNGDLTPTQRRKIVESIDKAKTLREVKLLYKGLTESLARSRDSLKEGAVRRPVSSASKTVPGRSAPTVQKEGVELDRWALLAGIKSDKK